MGYFAEIDSNTVVSVIVAPSKEWCEQNIGGHWEQTYKEETPRRYARVGWEFLDANIVANITRDDFIMPSPHPSWVINGNVVWEPPIEYPDDEGNIYVWDEDTINWLKIT